jgi:hypothetical protein
MKFFARYISKAAVILQNRDNLNENCCYKFCINNLTVGMENASSKNFDKINNIALEFITEGDFESKEKFLETSNNYIEVILSLLTLSTIRYCSKAQLTNVTEIKENAARASTIYYLDFFGDNTTHEAIHFFDLTMFDEFFTHFNAYPDPNFIFRAISWFRKGLDEKDVNRFVTFWFGLEVLKEIPPITGNKWEKIEKIFENDLNNHDFSHIKNDLKEKLFDGTHPLNPSFVNEINNNTTILQRALFVGISKELGISNETIDKIVKLIRTEDNQRDLYLVLIGELEKFPPSLDHLMNAFPVLEMKIKNTGPPTISQNFQKISFDGEYLFTNFQDNQFFLNERQVWSKQGMTESGKTFSSIRLKDAKQDTLKISFDAGKHKTNNNEKSVIFKPWMKLLNEGSSAGKISYLFLADGKNEMENLQLFGALCCSPAGHILFYPGFEYEYFTKFDNSFKISSKSYYLIDHLTLLKGAEKWHITGFDTDGEKKHQYDYSTKKIADGLHYWFSLNIQRQVYFENVCKENILKYSYPSPIADRMKEEIIKSRQDCDDYIICPIDARTDSASAFYHFDVFYLEGNISPKYPLTSYLVPSELVKLRNLSDTLAVNYTEIKIPMFDGKIIIASTIVSGDLSDLVIVAAPK